MPQQGNQQPQNQPQIPQRNQPMNQQQAQAQVAAQAQAQANAQATRLAMMQRPSNPNAGQGTLKLMLFVDQLGKFNSSRGDPNDIAQWQAFTDKFFTETGSFIHVVFSALTERTKMFEIVHAAMPRYFHTQFNTDVESLQITLDGATEKNAPTECKVTCDRAKFIYTYKNQCQVGYVENLPQTLLT
jgi:hypothetical protein